MNTLFWPDPVALHGSFVLYLMPVYPGALDVHGFPELSDLSGEIRRPGVLDLISD
jgi:hypothetical protein